MAAPNSIYESAYKGDFDVIKPQVDEDPTLIKKTDDNKRTLLHWAAISGSVKLVTLLIEYGAEIDAREETDATPLILASSAGRAPIVNLLIQNKADVNHKTTQGHSSLQYAASKGWLEICVKLVESGADINIADVRGATPLHRAASKGNLAIVKYLLSQKEDLNLNVKDVYGNTPLHLACEEDRQEEAKLLVENGAQLDIQNKEKQTPLDLCMRGLSNTLSTLNFTTHKQYEMSTTNDARNEVDILRLPVNCEEQVFPNWTIKYTKSHILHSQCSTADKCLSVDERCQFCIYSNSLDLPHLPEMVFPNNILYLTHVSGAVVQFSALEALKRVCTSQLPMKVACSEAWKESRPAQLLEEKIKPFDWTFSSDYKGTVTGPCKIEETVERIDIERLKEKEKILFYQELMLYEDELHDNGIASCTVKIRVMPSSFFVLVRFFLRVDSVMVRINDTRLFHDFNTNYILREYTNKECGVNEIHLPLPMFGDPNLLSPYVPLKYSCYEKLIFADTNQEGNDCSAQEETSV